MRSYVKVSVRCRSRICWISHSEHPPSRLVSRSGSIEEVSHAAVVERFRVPDDNCRPRKWFGEQKLFGYFDPSVCTLLMDISEFGLQAAPDQAMQAEPRFHMDYLDQCSL